MKNRTLTAAITMSLLSGVALADSYQGEAGFIYDNSKLDNTPSYNSYTIGGSFYFNPVNDSKGPRMEAAFLDRASSVSASFTNSDSDLFDRSYTLDTRVVLNNGFILKAGYGDLYRSEKTYQVGIGTYLTDRSDIVASYTRAKNADIDTWDVTYHGVEKLAGTSSVGYSVGAGYVRLPTSSNGYRLDADLTYYFDANLGLGALASYADYDILKTTTFGIQANYFVTPLFYVEGYAKTTDYDGPSEDSFGVGASLRF
ncbi:MAG: putative porin [Pseudomonadales bacterium]|nr:putative porin [Pseudomonadales bacterium]